MDKAMVSSLDREDNNRRDNLRGVDAARIMAAELVRT